MITFGTVPELKAHLRRIQAQGLRVGLVPTMGALHAGHLSLVRAARTRAEVVVASIFVNPTQFGPAEDLARYPRDLEADREKLEAAGCHVIFAPEPEVMYPAGFETEVEVLRTSRGLCGDRRPGHFKGVTTVVLKLLTIVRPDVAVFGEKDLQQLAVIRSMARDLCLDTEIAGAELVREPDGIAMSSRNAYLSPDERRRALALSRGLHAAKAAYDAGEREARVLLETVRASMASAQVVPEYVEIRSYPDLGPAADLGAPSAILTAARVGPTRLIDNVVLRRP